MHIYVFLTNFCGHICLFRISVRHPVKRDPPRSARFLSVSAAPPLELAYIILYKHIYAYQTKLRGKNRLFWTQVRLPLKTDPAQAWLFFCVLVAPPPELSILMLHKYICAYLSNFRGKRGCFLLQCAILQKRMRTGGCVYFGFLCFAC